MIARILDAAEEKNCSDLFVWLLLMMNVNSLDLDDRWPWMWWPLTTISLALCAVAFGVLVRPSRDQETG